jgi:hypothetical protein
MKPIIFRRNSLRIILLLLISSCLNKSFAQDDLMKILGTDTTNLYGPVSATFKTTRIINVQSLETLGKRTLDFRISHRFGDWSTGSYNFYGMDGPASIRLALEYSYDGRLMAGIGRSSYEKMYDGFLKYKIIRQKAAYGSPISMTAVSTMDYTTQNDPNQSITGINEYQYPTSRMSFVNELIVGRKFNEKLSLQTSFYMVHYNIVQHLIDKNDIYAAGIAGRYKLTKRFALTGEYVYRITTLYAQGVYYNPLGFGFEVETGGHVFQIQLTNAFAIDEGQVIPFTTTSWKTMGFRIGFNLSRVFTL